MCGIAGYLVSNKLLHPEGILQRMAGAIAHRGPDAYGAWLNMDSGVGLAHRRLSILELSQAGAQPMASACGRYVIAFNGEIYNHLELRTKLREYSPLQSSLDGSRSDAWRGHSDTETVLACLSAWGVRGTVERCVGMFAFAVWDTVERELTLARDRLGEKPLYFGWQGLGNGEAFLFGSELSAIKAHPAFSARINRDALCLLMRHSYIPAPHSIYEGIYKLLPGYLLTVSLARREPVLTQYWSLPRVAEQGVERPFTGSDTNAVNALEDLLKDVVRQQIVADVPLGAFLSGGIDSSTVVALMQTQSSRPVKTFTIGFDEVGYNEAVHTKAVAKHLGTDHTELYVTPQHALNVIPRLPQLYSEPFSDSSQIPTFLVSQLARQDVKVALSGDGGDELFAGYNRYVLTSNLWRKLSRLPRGLRSSLATGVRSLSPTLWNLLLSPVYPLLPMSLHQANVGDKLHKGAGVVAAKSVADLYLGLVTHWEPEELVLGGREPFTCLRGNQPPLADLDVVQRMMVLDGITYLPDDILAKTDRAMMGVSLEGRVPFVDHRVVEFAWTLPQRLKLRDGIGKWVLRQVLYRHVPKELIERPKMGFGVPIDSWLRGPLREWAESLLDESRLKQEGFFNPAPVRQKWNEHLSGKRNWHYHLWDVLMFQAWLEHQNH